MPVRNVTLIPRLGGWHHLRSFFRVCRKIDQEEDDCSDSQHPAPLRGKDSRERAVVFGAHGVRLETARQVATRDCATLWINPISPLNCMRPNHARNARPDDALLARASFAVVLADARPAALLAHASCDCARKCSPRRTACTFFFCGCVGNLRACA